MPKLYKGILIDQSVSDPKIVLKFTNVVGKREAKLEGESFRGKVLFYNIEVSADNLWPVLSQVAESIKSPGWYFHLVNDNKLYIAMPNVVLIADNNEAELQGIVDYASNHGIHPDQLNLKQLFDNPFA